MPTPYHRKYTPTPVPAHSQCLSTKNCQAGLAPSRDLIQTQKLSSFSISRRQVGIIKLCPTQLPPARCLPGLQDPRAISHASITGDFACPTLSFNLRHRFRTSQDRVAITNWSSTCLGRITFQLINSLRK
ncbi:hypothetical protein F5Y00DRAFT_255953 [Daldinia vernicosa]|uniref:uncharacterized protein n=1 Tax=Daldinia vernicosa TaxID=114800 RepID=UPI002007E44C|nr:uncharacterized protein F5Y00DRAFT_255953 [Daldinia vernicosa]KAI0844494.1 hypothetical protein F5Y00DRAFT_255953 [Daldinia vernicosa]